MNRRDEKERRRRIEAAAKRAGVPYVEGVFFKGSGPSFVECVVECSLYPSPRWWIEDRVPGGSGGRKPFNRRPLTLEEWSLLRKLEL